MSNGQRKANRDESRATHDHGPNRREEGKWLSALIGLLGLWLIGQALLLDLVAAQFWNDVVIGAALLALGAYNYARRGDQRYGNVAAAALAALLGLWLMAAPFVFGADAGITETANDLGFWNDLLVGGAVTVLGAYSAYRARDRRSDVRPAAQER